MEGFSVGANPYSVMNGCKGSLPPSGECRIEVMFTPTAAQVQNGALMIIDNAEHEPQSVRLEGKGKVN